MGDVPDNFALYALGAGFGLALLAAGIGLSLVVSGARKLGERIDEYGELPVFTTAELTQARIDIALDSIATLGVLRARALGALTEMQAARARLGRAATTTRDTLRLLVIGR